MHSKNMFWELLEVLIVAAILATIIRSFLVQPFYIPSGSMLTTLYKGDYLLVTRFSYDLKIPFTDMALLQTGEPAFGDVIVFRFPLDPSQDYIKRVIGLPGDEIEIRDKQVYRNGVKLEEAYARHAAGADGYAAPKRDNMAPRRVPSGHYFMLGDNRDFSEDSRYWGFVPRKNLVGRAWVVLCSWESWTRVRWDRLAWIIR